MRKKKNKVHTANKTAQMPPLDSKHERNNYFIFGTTFIYFLVIFFGLWNHEMWRDELQPWLTASSCHSLGDFFDTWKVQSDTVIWYTTLFLLSKITFNPVIVQAFHGVLALINAFFILRYSPFSRFNKIALCCGYYMLFEYGIISRGYGYTLFFLFLFCIIYQASPKRHILLSVILVLLANATGGYGMVLSGSLALALLSQFFFDKNGCFKIPISFKEIFAIVIIVGAGLFFAVKSITPPDDSVYKQTIFLNYDFGRFFLNIWRTILASFFAIPNFSNLHFWNTNILVHNSTLLLNVFMIFFAFAVLVYCTLLFSAHFIPIVFYLSATIGMLFFSYINDHIFVGFYARHYGFCFIVFVVSTWLYTRSGSQQKISLPFVTYLADRLRVEQWIKYVVTIFFVINALGGVVAYTKDMTNTFSTIQLASKYILDNRLENLPATGFKDYAISPVAAYTRKPIYYPDRDTTNTFVIWTVRKYCRDINQIIPRMMNFIKGHSDSVLVILNFELNTSIIEDVSFTHLISFKESVVADETLSLYIAEKFDLNKELKNLYIKVEDKKIFTYVNVAYGLLEQQKIDECERVLTKIQSKAVKVHAPRFHNCMGLLLLRRNRVGDAKNEFLKEIKLNLQKDEAYFQLGMVHYNEQKIDSSIYDWNRVIEINPNNMDAYNNIAVVHLNFKNDYSTAKRFWENAIGINPKYFQGYINLMLSAQNLKDSDGLLKYFKSALANGMTLDEIKSKGVVVTQEMLLKAM
jgi:hypothetical protein